MRKYGFSKELLAFFEIQAMTFFERPVEKLSLISLMTLCLTPPRHLLGGFGKFGGQLYGVILQHGGTILYNEPSSELVFSAGRAVGIKTAQGLIEADYFLLNALSPHRKSRVIVGLQENVIPISMAQDVLMLPDYRSPEEFMALSLRCNEENPAGPKGMKALSVSFSLQKNREFDRQLLLERLGGLIPFLKDYVVFAEEYNFEAGHATLPPGLKLRSTYTKEGASLLNRTSYTNVFVLNDKPEAPLHVLSAVQQLTRLV